MTKEEIISAAKKGYDTGWGLVGATNSIKKLGLSVPFPWTIRSQTSTLKLGLGELVFCRGTETFSFKSESEDGLGHTD